MNVFILTPGRTGSKTFVKACSHIINYTSAHESSRNTKSERRYNLEFPPNHIESDNRLIWFLGSLDKLYGKEAYYVKLVRDCPATIQSYIKRIKYNQGIIPAFALNIMQQQKRRISKEGYEWAIKHYINTAYDNIDFYLKEKPNKITIHIENPVDKFIQFWSEINAKGDLSLALKEFQIRYNASK